MTTHLHPDCTCKHRPGYPCDSSCKVHGIPPNSPKGLWQWNYAANVWERRP